MQSNNSYESEIPGTASHTKDGDSIVRTLYKNDAATNGTGEDKDIDDDDFGEFQWLVTGSG